MVNKNISNLINEANKEYEKGMDLFYNKNEKEAYITFGKAVKIYEELTKMKSPEAMFKYATMLENGWGIKKDKEKALECYKKAADKGNAPSAYNIAYYYEEKQNKKEAVKYYKKAADLGDKIAIEKYNSLLKEKGKELKKAENKINIQFENKRKNVVVLTDKQKTFLDNCEKGNTRIVEFSLKSENKNELIEGANKENYLFNLLNNEILDEKKKKISELLIINGAKITNNKDISSKIANMPLNITNNLKQIMGSKYFEDEEKTLNATLSDYKKSKFQEKSSNIQR